VHALFENCVTITAEIRLEARIAELEKKARERDSWNCERKEDGLSLRIFQKK
jgi:hypothetical protein